MEDSAFDADTFTTGNGIWHVVDGNKLDSGPNELMASVATGTTKSGKTFVVAFTDKDLAERFVKMLGKQNLVLFPFPNEQLWLNFLEDLPGAGYEYVAFDPGEDGRFADFGTIAALIDRVRESIQTK
jgi:hypothetical protein